MSWTWESQKALENNTSTPDENSYENLLLRFCKKCGAHVFTTLFPFIFERYRHLKMVEIR